MIFWFSARHGSHWLDPPPRNPVEVVEAPAVRPAVERPGRTLLAVGCQMPLAERGGAVAVVPQDPRQRRTVPRQGRGIAREPAGELADRAEPDGVVVPPRQQRRPRRRAQRRDVEPVVAQATLGQTCVVRRLDRSAERARVAEARVVDQHQQHVGSPIRRPRVPDQVPVGLGAGERLVDDSCERLTPDRQPAALRFTHRLRLLRTATISRAQPGAFNGPDHANVNSATPHPVETLRRGPTALDVVSSPRHRVAVDQHECHVDPAVAGPGILHRWRTISALVSATTPGPRNPAIRDDAETDVSPATLTAPNAAHQARQYRRARQRHKCDRSGPRIRSPREEQTRSLGEVSGAGQSRGGGGVRRVV